MSLRLPIFRFCITLLMAVTLLGAGPKRALSGEISPGGVITVDSFLDIDDNAPNSVCSAGHPTSGPCTLRAAIYEAGENVLSKNIFIKLPAGEYNLTIPPNDSLPNNHSGDLKIGPFDSPSLYSITIEPLGGGPVVIKNMVEDRILFVGTNANVIINNLTMRDGRILIDSNEDTGGGAIQNWGTLSLDGVSLLNNTVNCREGSPCQVSAVVGGAVQNYGKISLLNSTLDGNTADRGSAIFNVGNSPDGAVSISYTTISNNHALSQSVITHYYGVLSILNSTFSGNDSLDPNSALSGIENWGTVYMRSSTMANKGRVGGILNFESPPSTATVQDNIFVKETGFTNCIVQENSNWTSYGYNIANDDSCQLTATGDLSSVDPLLGGFGNWGGLTKTYMLKSGSPALNHRPDECWFSSNFLIDDQRHWPRSDGQCDTGAYEFSPWYLYLPIITK